LSSPSLAALPSVTATEKLRTLPEGAFWGKPIFICLLHYGVGTLAPTMTSKSQRSKRSRCLNLR